MKQETTTLARIQRNSLLRERVFTPKTLLFCGKKTVQMGSNFPLLFITVLILFFPAGDSDRAADRAALLLFSSAVRGNTLRWKQSDPNPCSWSGVYCDNDRVTRLRLPADGLVGQIPEASIGNLTQLRILSLRRNSLSGPLPSDLGSCAELRRLFLQENQFSGTIPATLFGLNNLVRFNIASNKFSGEISSEFNNLTRLKTLYLENNQLTGSLPELPQVTEFNVSFNRLNGSIPSSLRKFDSSAFLNNSLCGSPLTSCPGNGNKLSGGAIAGIVVGSVTGSLLICVALFILWRRYIGKKTQRRVKTLPSPKPVVRRELSSRPEAETAVAEAANNNGGGGNDGLVFFGDGDRNFSLEELLRASAEVLGKGTFGSTYRAYLAGGNQVIVKRLKKVCVYEIEFKEKVEELGVLAHENLVPLRAYYYGREEKLLAFDCMPMGSLAALLHGNRGADRAPLTWEVRSSIALGAACGIKYLHALGSNVSHGNIKSSNILLTDYYDACVSEYCINQLVSSNSNVILNGYCAPEVTDSRRISQKADVYSFGVLLLELLTGKTPTHASSDEEGLDLPGWVQSVVQQKWTIDVLDPELLRDHQNIEEQMVQLLHLAINCTYRYPDRRPPMEEVAQRIKQIRGLR
ncbi:probable inactive receptor kinase RLK902 [Cornus florida]|uniref:probable inactive receptor kinase RLK902 n=1 Tax=Cornus florida TaxID=4283 RepID=UPI0028A03606|nr:probable inactive receptor kinase RLK902 [Cornus florida]